jgi:4-hydroxy-tetrahydrodipicolinate reductase
MSGIKLAVIGASGRMGQAILRLAKASGDFDIVSEVSEGDDFSKLEKSGAQVAIDFSKPEATRALVDVASRAKIALVIGTTGLDDDTKKSVAAASEKIAIFAATNMSVGVHVLGVLAERASRMLGEDYDIEIIEAHHKRKIDAPSGTALTLAKTLQESRHHITHLVHGREGNVGPRSPREVGMHAVRGGDVVGDHSVYFFGEADRIELTHRASNRDLFARGALRAAKWVSAKSPGFYGMREMIDETIGNLSHTDII